jgi:hypothetical protein
MSSPSSTSPHAPSSLLSPRVDNPNLGIPCSGVSDRSGLAGNALPPPEAGPTASAGSRTWPAGRVFVTDPTEFAQPVEPERVTPIAISVSSPSRPSQCGTFALLDPATLECLPSVDMGGRVVGSMRGRIRSGARSGPHERQFLAGVSSAPRVRARVSLSGPSGRAWVVAGACDARLVALEDGQGGAGSDAGLVQIAERAMVA